MSYYPARPLYHKEPGHVPLRGKAAPLPRRPFCRLELRTKQLAVGAACFTPICGAPGCEAAYRGWDVAETHLAVSKWVVEQDANHRVQSLRNELVAPGLRAHGISLEAVFSGNGHEFCG